MNVKVTPASPSAPSPSSSSPAARALLAALGVLLLLCGLFLAGGGGYLLSLGGSAYFVAMGVALIVCGVLIARRMRAGAWLFAVASIATVAWALDDVGLEFWPLVSRLFAVGVLGLLVSLAYPALVRAGGRVPSHKASGGVTLALLFVLAVSFGLMFTPKSVVTNPQVASVKPVVPGSEQKNWEHWGNTTTGTRFAALDQITRANIGELQVAWTARTGDIPASNGSGAEDQNTPLQIGDSLYVCTAYGKVLSLDADTGAQRWMFDPKGTAPNWQRCRGLGYFDASAAPAPAATPAAALPAPAVASAPPLVPAASAPEAASQAGTPASAAASSAPVVSTAASASVASEEAPASAAETSSAPGASAGLADATTAAPTTTVSSSRTVSTDTVSCTRRLFLPTIDARLIAIDADSGKPCAGFGTDGVVDLKVGMGEVKPGYYQQTSTPLVAGEVVIVGGRVADNFSTGEPPGVVRAFDVRTGALAWAWDPGNPDITRLPPEGRTYTRGTPNVWSAMAYDPKLGLVYLPTGNATPDFFGGQRTALDDKYSSSIVAVDVATGRVRWSYQTTHHDLWDFDLPAQPLLYDLPDGKGGTLPALVQITKQGMIFMLDRVTGKPAAEVQEREVPQGHVPGERYAATQPFSTGMPSIGNQTLIESDMWGGTPFDQLLCRIAFKKMRHEGVYTPPGLDPALQFPGSLGGMNWGSVSVDASNDVMFVNDMRLGLANYMIPRQDIPQGASGIEMGVVPQEGTPFGARRDRFLSQLGIPCQAPPYGTMSAIDLKTRKLLWQVPVGTVEDTGPLGIRMHLPIPIGMPTLGASLATQSGLVFFAGTQDFYLRAFDSGTGREIWKARLPVGSQSGPMTYVSPKTGKQYVVVSAGGARQSSDRGDYVIAYALPK